MNVERVYAILSVIKEELEAGEIINNFQLLVKSLQNQVNQPNQPNLQQQVSTNLENLEKNIENAYSNDFSPAWKMLLKELNIADFLGNNLLLRIKEIFSRNQILPATVLKELQKLYAQLNSYNQSINQLIDGFSNLKISKGDLKPGECEIGVLIPRKAINNKLEDLSKELKEINFVLGTFEEIATGQRKGLELRSISSSEPSFFFDSLPAFAACMAFSVERIVALYKNLLEIKRLRNELKDQGVKPKDMKGVESHANKIIDNGIKKLCPEIMKKFSVIKNDGRKNELEISLRISLNKIANRIDKGFNFEVRIETEYKDDKTKTSKDKNIALILEKSKGLEFIKTSGESILSLPEKRNDKKGK